MPEVSFTDREKEFLEQNEACRVATSNLDVPHVTPVSYVFEDGTFFFATDYETRKYKNLKENPRIALVVDEYSSVGNKAVMVQGTVEFIESGEEFKRLYEIFDKKFEWVSQDPWKEGEAPFIKITPTRKVSWGLD